MKMSTQPSRPEAVERNPAIDARTLYAAAEQDYGIAAERAKTARETALDNLLVEGSRMVNVQERDSFFTTLAESAVAKGNFEYALRFAREITDPKAKKAIRQKIWELDIRENVRIPDRGERVQKFIAEVDRRKAAVANLPSEEKEPAYIAIARIEANDHGWRDDAVKTVDELARLVPGSTAAHAEYITFIRSALSRGDFNWATKLLDERITDPTEKDDLCASFAANNRNFEEVKALLGRVSDRTRADDLAVECAKLRSKNLGAVEEYAGIVADVTKRVALILEVVGNSEEVFTKTYELPRLQALGSLIPDVAVRHALYVRVGSRVGNPLEVMKGIATLMKTEEGADTASADRMFETNVRARSTDASFARSKKEEKWKQRDNSVKRWDSYAQAHDTALEIKDIPLRDDAYGTLVTNVSKTVFADTDRSQEAFYGIRDYREKKMKENLLLLSLGNIHDPNRKQAALSALAGSLETHLQNLQAARMDKSSGSSREERQQIRKDVIEFAKELLSGLKIEKDSDMEAKLKAIIALAKK